MCLAQKPNFPGSLAVTFSHVIKICPMKCKQQLYGSFELFTSKRTISLFSFQMLKSDHIVGTPATVLNLKINVGVKANFEDGET